jgi:hypothetical protein
LTYQHSVIIVIVIVAHPHQAALARRQLDSADAAAKKAREEDETLKKTLLAALVSKAKAQAKLAQREGAESSAVEELDGTLATLGGWVEPLEHAPRLMVDVEKVHGRPACALAVGQTPFLGPF